MRSEREHGFLNFLTAADRAAAGADEAELRDILATTDASELTTGSAARPRAVRLDRLVLVRRAGRGPPGAGPAVTRPLGVFSPPGGAPRVGARDGDRVLDIAAVGPAVLANPSLNPLMAAGPQRWAEVAAIDDAPDFGLGDVELHLPFEVADYVDFYSSIEHATNLGRLFRPDVEPLLPNWRHLPVGYHGRAGTVVPSGTPIRRPARPDQAARRRRAALRPEPPARHRARARLRDRAAEPARRAGAGRARARPRLRARARQRLERARHPGLGVRAARPVPRQVVRHLDRPLGAAARRRRAPPRRTRRRRSPSRCPTCARSRGRSTSRSRSSSTATSSRARNARHLYWSVAQQVAHLTVNGAALRTGDLLASGTISGPGEATSAARSSS